MLSVELIKVRKTYLIDLLKETLVPDETKQQIFVQMQSLSGLQVEKIISLIEKAHERLERIKDNEGGVLEELLREKILRANNTMGNIHLKEKSIKEKEEVLTDSLIAEIESITSE